MRRYNYVKYEDEVKDGGEGQTQESAAPEPVEDSWKQEKEAMQRKIDELMTETKNYKAKARREEEERHRSIGDFEQLHKSSEAEREKLQKQLEEVKMGIAREKEQTTAIKLANELADGHNAEILAEFISRRLKYTEDGIRITDSNGGLTVSSLKDLKAEFEADAKYSSLIRGTKAQGGGAPGGGGGAPTEKVISRTELNQMAPDRIQAFFKAGGKVID